MFVIHATGAPIVSLPQSTTRAEFPEAGFRGPQVCAIVGITYRQLDYWARTDLLRPSLADAKGSGSQRLYSYRDLVELKVIKSLLDAGVGLGASRKAIAYLRSNLGEDLANANLVLSGDRPLLVRDGGEILDLVRQGQGVLNIVSLESMKTRIDTAITELHPAEPDAPELGNSARSLNSASHQAVNPMAEPA
jgi:DNA-binding transcriptional MerR regulator